MILAIQRHDSVFTERWIEGCKRRSVPYRVVDCFSNGIMDELRQADGLLWRWRHDEGRAFLVARQVIHSAELVGLKVFPSTHTCWHFDDKIGQKYLLEAIDAPLVPTFVFYDEEEARRWIMETEFPKVFKLKGGAGSENVKLIQTQREALALCKTAFSTGFVASPRYTSDLRHKLSKIASRSDLLAKIRRAPKSIAHRRLVRKSLPVQFGYLYFQEFMPENKYDTRVTIVGNRAFAFRRWVREGDFRASGSGNFDLDPKGIDPRCVKIAFEVAERLRSQSTAFDFVFDPAGEPRIVEISYTYVTQVVQSCPGHWDREHNWHEGNLWPQEAILDDLIASIERDRP